MSNTNESFGEVANFFQKNRAAISRAEKIRNQALELTPNEIKKVISLEYNLWSSNSAKKQGWLVIYNNENRRFKYVIGYYAVFHEDEKIPSYRIEFMAEGGDEPTKQLQSQLLSTSHAQLHGLEADNSAPHHILGKTYQLSTSDYSTFPQIIADNLRNDWHPLEKYWLTENSDLL